MGMEEDTRAFLIKIIQTISLVLLWMLVNVFIGIYKEYGFMKDKFTWANGLFYAFSVGSLLWLIIHLKRKWKL